MDISILDVGTSSVKSLISVIDGSGGINVVGFSNVKNSGMSKSKIVDIDATINAIQKSVQEAELMAGVKASNMYVSIGGSDIIGIASKGIIATKSSKSEIRQEDIIRVIEHAKVVLTMDNNILHIIPQEFTVDDQTCIKNPVGLIGSKLSAETMVIAVPNIIIQNLNNAVERSGFKINDYISQHVAAYHSVLDKEEMELGVALIDIGGGCIKLSIFFDSFIRYIDTIDIGGDNITKDLSIGLRITKSDAETLKINNGTCIKDNINTEDKITIPGLNDRESRSISLLNVFEIIAPRIDEIIELVQKSIEKSGYFHKLNAGIVITGGGANLKGLKERFERKTNLPVKIGYPQKLFGITESINNPMYSVPIGMVNYVHEMYKSSGSFGSKHKASINKGFSNVYSFVKDMFKL